jgi:hypothetical protein
LTKISANKIGFTILASFILIAPLLTSLAYSLSSLPGTSNILQTSTIESAVRNPLIGSNLLDTIDSNSSNDIDIELDDSGNNNGILENLLELDESTDTVNPQDEITRENLKELLAGSVTNNLLSNKIAGNLEAIEEQGSAGLLASARSIQEREFSQLEALELATEAAAVISDLNGIFSKCDTATYDMAVHTIKGKTDLNKILSNVKNNDDISIELIVDNKPTETSLILVGSPAVFLKGLINTDPYHSDPKEYDYDISHINSDCIAKTLTDKQLEIKSGIKQPLIIPRESRLSTTAALEGGKFFQPCQGLTTQGGVTTGADFAKYKLIGTSKEIQHKDLSINGKVDLTVKIFVDFNVGVSITSKDPATVTDDNRIVAMQLIANEGKNGEKKFEFIPKDALTECTTVTFLQEPQNIANKEVFGDPLYGFKKNRG